MYAEIFWARPQRLLHRKFLPPLKVRGEFFCLVEATTTTRFLRQPRIPHRQPALTGMGGLKGNFLAKTL